MRLAAVLPRRRHGRLHITLRGFCQEYRRRRRLAFKSLRELRPARATVLGWRVLTAPEPLVQQLRLLCRDEVALIEQRTAMVNQLQQALYEYYPAALEAFEDWCAPSAWAFVERFPTPQSLVQAGKRKWQNFLHAQKLFHPEWNQKRMEIFAKADQFCGAEATIAAKSALAVATVKILQTLEAQLARYRALITERFKQHPDHGLFASLPGA